MKVIAYRRWIGVNPGKINRNKLFYVSQVPGDGGKDWGYVTDFSQAIVLNEAQAKRFAVDCRAVGYSAQFLNAA